MTLRSSEALSDSSISPAPYHTQPKMPVHFEPYQSDAFRQVRARVQSLSTPPARSPPHTYRELSLASTSIMPSAAEVGTEAQVVSSPTPSPPVSEASCPPTTQSPSTEASDSSASSICDDETSHYHRRTSSSKLRPSFATKRVLSEGDVIMPRPTKRTCIAITTALRKRSLNLVTEASSSRVPSVASSWRMAREQQRERNLAKRNKAEAAAKVHKAKRSKASAPATESNFKVGVLPELRLLSATRTAPIGWSQYSGASAFMPKMVESYDEREASRAPERQRFWPIVDRQLDYTGARMLSLSTTSLGPIRVTGDGAKNFDDPISPKSALLPSHTGDLLSITKPYMPMRFQAIGSSDEDASPLTPDAPLHAAVRSVNTVSQRARDITATESSRKPTIPLSPKATLSAVIDFTRAKAAAARTHDQQRNAYGQPFYSPPSPRPEAVELAPHAPPRIAPRRQAQAGATTTSNNGRDYFGHWERYLCHYGKESTF